MRCLEEVSTVTPPRFICRAVGGYAPKLRSGPLDPVPPGGICYADVIYRGTLRASQPA